MEILPVCLCFLFGYVLRTNSLMVAGAGGGGGNGIGSNGGSGTGGNGGAGGSINFNDGEEG